MARPASRGKEERDGMPTSSIWLVALGMGLGIVATLIVWAVGRGLGGRGGAFGGAWEQTLADGHGGVRARDRVVCRQSGATLRGVIRRVEPTVEDYKEWRFGGRIEGPLAICAFWGADKGRTPASYGALSLSLVAPGQVEGFRLTRQVEQHGARFAESTLDSKLTWTRAGAAPATAKMTPAEAAEARKTGSIPPTS